MKNDYSEKDKNLIKAELEKKVQDLFNRLAIKYDYIKNRDTLFSEFNEVYTNNNFKIKSDGELKKLKEYMLDLLKEYVSRLSQKKLNEVVLRYIDKIMFNVDNLEDFNRFFKMYTRFFDTFGVEHSDDLITCVSQSGMLNEILDYYIDNFKDKVVSGEYYDHLANSMAVPFIGLYAIKNGIEIKPVVIDEKDITIDSSIDDVEDKEETQYKEELYDIEKNISTDKDDDSYFILDTDYELEDEEDSEKEDIESDEEDFSQALDGYAGDELDFVKIYLQEIGKIPLLTYDQEVEYGKRISQAYNYLCERLTEMNSFSDIEKIVQSLDYDKIEYIIKIGNYNNQDIKRIYLALKQYVYYRDKMSESNLRLVVSIAKKYVGRGMLFLDLIQEGNLGLLKAINKYDYKKGYKFSTYATWWIRQSITRAIADKAKTVRIPVHMVEAINKVRNATRDLTTELGREPTVDEISKYTKFDKDKIIDIQKIDTEPVSINSYVGDDQDSELVDFIPDENVKVEETVMNSSMIAQMQQELDNAYIRHAKSDLTAKEYLVLKARFGVTYPKDMKIDLDTDKLIRITKEYEDAHYTEACMRKTLDQTADYVYEILLSYMQKYYDDYNKYCVENRSYDLHSVTKERIRQCEAKALRKLRKKAAFKHLFAEYVNETRFNKDQQEIITRPSDNTEESIKPIVSIPLFRESQYHALMQESSQSLYEVKNPTARDRRDAVKVSGIRSIKRTNNKKI